MKTRTHDLRMILHRPCKGSRRAGFWLSELIVSLGILGILLTGIHAALFVVLKSVAPTDSPVMAHVRTGEIGDRVLTDLTMAQSFTINTATDVEFKVPSRDGDSNPDTIRYQWTGSPANQLLRSYNGGPLNVFATDVEEFGLSYLTRTMGPPPPPAAVESGEVLLMEHNDLPGGSFSNFTTSTSNRCSQWFTPAVSPDTISWKITRVQCFARRDTGTSANFLVQIQSGNQLTKQPLTTVLSSLTVSTATLSTSFAWVNFDIPDVPGLTPEAGYCLVLAVTQTAAKYPIFQFETNSSVPTPRAHWMTSSNSGSTWTLPEATRDMRFRIYGTVTTQPL